MMIKENKKKSSSRTGNKNYDDLGYESSLCK